MKLKMVIVAVLATLVALNALPVYATDFSSYVEATKDKHWTFGDFAHVNLRRNIAGGTASKMWKHRYVENIGDVPLTEAILLIRLLFLRYYDDSGTLITVTDPVELAQLLWIENSDEVFQDSYVTWLGTIQPGHSKRAVYQFWINVSNWLEFGYQFALWYLP